MIENRQYKIRRSDISPTNTLVQVVENALGKKTLRWYIAQITKDEIVIEATTYAGELNQPGEDVRWRCYPGKSVVLNVIPTGIGCSVGGYAGDAAPVTNLLASTVDYVVTNPNALNASDFIGIDSRNIVYTEGYSMDLFCKGLVDLHVPYSNRIGLVIERSDDRQLEAVFNVLNAARAVHGIDVIDHVITERPIGGRCVENRSGAFVGTLDNPRVLFDACEKLLNRGANAIAITSNIQDLPLDNYAKHFDGEYPNPVGGVEAVISFLVTSQYHVPAAHAPLANIKLLDLVNNVVDARGAGEAVSYSGLGCVLMGLRKAPQITLDSRARTADIININNLLAVVLPATALGGIPAVYADRFSIPVIAVQENQTILDITQEKVRLGNVTEVRSYAEAAGIIMALKSGISLESLSRPLKTVRPYEERHQPGELIEVSQEG